MTDSPLSLNKLLPDYFNKSIFRLAVLSILLLFLFTAWSNDWKNEFPYVYCPETTEQGCFIDRDLIINKEYIPEFWDGVYLSAGEVLGQKPNHHYFAFKRRVWLIIISAFIINHGYYWVRTKRFKPEINKNNFEKLKKAFSEVMEEEIK